jgi:hypothetical protein
MRFSSPSSQLIGKGTKQKGKAPGDGEEWGLTLFLGILRPRKRMPSSAEDMYYETGLVVNGMWKIKSRLGAGACGEVRHSPRKATPNAAPNTPLIIP